MDVRTDIVEFLRGEEMAEFLPALLRLVAEGEPVPLSRLATSAGVEESRIAAWLRAQPGTDWADDGRLLGFGLTQRPTQHRFVVDGRELFTFCAADTLLFPPIVGRPAHIESTCPATGTPIRLDVAPDAVESVEPITAVVSQVDYCVGRGDIRATTCDHGHFFADHDASEKWCVEHPGGQVLPVSEVFAQGLWVHRQMGWIACC